MRGLFRLAAMSVVASVCIAQDIVFEDSGPEWLERYIAVPSARFVPETVEELATEQLKGSENRHLVKIVIGTRRGDLLQMRKGKAAADFSYQYWANTTMESLPQRGSLALLMSIKGNVALKTYDARSASLSEKILRGTAPLDVATDERRAVIVHVSFSRVPFAGRMDPTITFFLQVSEALSLPQASRLAVALRTKVSLPARILVVLRRDAWFLEDETFPLFEPFQAITSLPSLQQYVCSPTIVCGFGEEGASCHLKEYTFGRCEY